MPALLVTISQQNYILNPMAGIDPTLASSPIAEALVNGVDSPVTVHIIPPMITAQQWADVAAEGVKLGLPLQQQTIDGLRLALAAFIKVMNFNQPGIGTPATPIVVSFLKPDGITTGTITFVGGLAVSST